ncbi:hypothetical protein HQQ94_18665 [Shewanella sp. VB17]|uniref:hypothetical protein n=1 Tax=Shewanella sp. VB17 TaxID=2739432 RepID=UPI0015646D7B|nr:hypothetical protein [Shewanella sp. VB17]NRD75207.1 hypothetical protein [Shewanella sp. VB17]
MTKEEALKKLEALKPELQKRKGVYEKIDKETSNIDEDSAVICGPRNEKEYQEMVDDIKESGDG